MVGHQPRNGLTPNDGQSSDPELRRALQQYFGFTKFRSGQEQAVRSVLSGRDTLVVMPTGSGKSLIYQLGGLLRTGMALVISPLIVLMKDQTDGLGRHGIAATFINSHINLGEQARRLRDIQTGQYKIVLIAPERLASKRFHDMLGRVFRTLTQQPRTDEPTLMMSSGLTEVQVALRQWESVHAVKLDHTLRHGQVHVELFGLDNKALGKVDRQVRQWREHRFRLLETMVANAQTTGCRRRALLDYFGDPASGQAESCCDNCEVQAKKQARSQARRRRFKQPAWIVLKSVSTLEFPDDVETLARMLHGSFTSAAADHAAINFKGKLASLPVDETRSLIEQLIAADYLHRTSGGWSTLQLTEKKRIRALESKSIRLGDATAQIEKTQKLATQGISSEQIAVRLGRSIKTVFHHLALLIREGKISPRAVLPPELRKQVWRVITELGSADDLWNIKKHLPEATQEGLIRCVAAAWERWQQRFEKVTLK